MTDLFLDILNLSFSATWVVLAVVLARLLLKRAPRWMVCSLWALVGLRLLFGGIEAPFSLIPSAEIIPPESLFDQAPAIHSGLDSIDSIVNPVYSESLRPTPGASVNPLQVWLAVFANLWVLVMGTMALWAGVSCRRVSKRVRESIPDGDGVYLCDSIDSPFIFGLFRPKIYLPSDLGGQARAHVIAHEKAHLQRRDHWWKPLGFLLLTVNWFNPAMWLSYILLCRDIELACDEKVVRELGVEEKKSYSAALLRCSVNARPITACPLAFGEVGVKHRVRSVLNYKKPAFWIILTAAVLTTVLAAGLLTDPLSPDPEIRWEGVLYIQEGRSVKSLPEHAENVGTLRSALHDGTTHPNENSQSVHLDWEYAGQPIYLADGTLYIEEPGGERWLPFVPKHSPADVLALLDQTVQIDLSLEGETVCIREFIRDYVTREDTLGLREILSDDTLQMAPSLDWEHQMLAVNYAENISMVILARDSGQQCTLVRRENDWLMIYRDESWAVTAWAFESPRLDAAIEPWQQELAYTTELFSEYAAEENPVYLNFETLTMLEISMRMGTPTSSFGVDSTDTFWEWQGSTSTRDRTIGIMCRPFGKATWMWVNYYDSSEARYAGTFQTEPITLSSGAEGTLYHSGDPARWELITLDTARGQLEVWLDTTHGPSDWTEKDYRMALTLLGTLSLTENGNSLFSAPVPSMKESDLGISTHLENLTPEGATLVCTQDGSPWQEITTGADWFLQEYQDGIWVDLLPEEAVWTTEAYPISIGGSRSFQVDWSRMIGSLEPGRYRILKVFTGYEQLSLYQASGEPLTQICSAEFELNPLGITLSVENVTPGGCTLVCAQDGTLWTSITTGAPWNLEQYENGEWIAVMPESTVWTSIAYMVNQGQTTSWNLNWSQLVGTLEPGRYRVSKTFWGERRPIFTLGLENEETQQTIYAEFTIE